MTTGEELVRFGVSSGLSGLSGLSGMGIGFSPTDIEGLELWLKADTGTFQDSAKTTPATSDGDVVGAWEDQSGNGNDALQGTMANKPLLKLSIANGLPVIRFDGADDLLISALDLSLGASDNLTIFAVANPDNTVAVKMIVGNRGAVGNQPCILVGHTAAEELRFRTRRSAADQPIVAAATADTDFVLGTFQLNSGTQELYRNGSFEGSVAQADMTGHETSTFIGMSRATTLQPYSGDIAEIIIYNFSLSASERGFVEAYLNTRYAIF